ncbi:PREDICTED: doublecortin domain-containing protein 2B isoform X2 [Lepidothrix coronata]|uniref:Doublecortin domain-containing protein 2B isoform X2 n=1 Tax=Lepidothrix coronata TaxID=321398 RepID=A0A6J0ID64_9PASS|nr:PREDICTED: doublecortin domain-containing protein 2B isoform X2 [Lepidothrix coronata]
MLCSVSHWDEPPRPSQDRADLSQRGPFLPGEEIPGDPPALPDLRGLSGRGDQGPPHPPGREEPLHPPAWPRCRGAGGPAGRGPVRGSGVREAPKAGSRAADPWKSNTFVQRQQLSRLPCTIHSGNAGSSRALGCFSCSVFQNGDLLSPPFPLVLPKRIPLEWDTLLATLTEKVELGSGAVNKLCRLDGTPVCGGEELENGHHYVAVGKEEYKPLPYRELLVPQECRTLGNHPKNRQKKSQGRLGSRRVQATGAAEKGKIPPAFPQLQIPARESPLEEEEPIFHVKPVRAGQNRRSSRSVQPGPGKSLSKPRDPRREMRGAREEGEHTRLDVPIDQV